MALIDLQARYGDMVPLAELSRLFHANQRAMRSALDRRSVPIYEIGSSVVVPLRLVEQAFGLAELLDDPNERHQAALDRAGFRADGSRKPLEEFAAEVDARSGSWLAAIDGARAGTGR